MDRPVYKSLTETYSNHFFDKKGIIPLKQIYSFIRDVINKGKLIELSSFLLWEFLHKAGVWNKKDYLKFSKNDVLAKNIEHFFLKKNYKLACNHNTQLTKSDIEWQLVYMDSDENILGNTASALNTLFIFSKATNSLTPLKSFEGEIKGIYINKKHTVFVCSKGCLYKSADRGKSFQKVLQFSTSHSYFRHNNAFTERPNGDLFVGEYVCIWQNYKWHCAAYLYYSKDDGQNWTKISFLKDEKINKHVHIVKYCKLLKGLVLTDGDNKKKLWINLSNNRFDAKSPNALHGWKQLTRYHFQRGGHTAMIELKDKIFFGSDYLGGTNFFISTTDMKSFRRQIVPDPYRRAYFTNMIVRNTAAGSKEIWATLYAGYSSKTSSLLMYSADDGDSWTKVIEYDGTTHIIEIISSSTELSNQVFIQLVRRNGATTTFCIKNLGSVN